MVTKEQLITFMNYDLSIMIVFIKYMRFVIDVSVTTKRFKRIIFVGTYTDNIRALSNLTFGS